jgi:very-short-patch-repair endonuclease
MRSEPIGTTKRCGNAPHHSPTQNPIMSSNPNTDRARELRQRQTKAESLLWDVVRAKRLCGLKFRRQYPIGPFFADFACVARNLIVELDGGYHDYQYADDLSRQSFLEAQGWSVMRFSNEDVLEDVEAVAISIAKQLGLEVSFGRRVRVASGMRCKDG